MQLSLPKLRDFQLAYCCEACSSLVQFFATFRCPLTRTAVELGIATLRNFYPTIWICAQRVHLFLELLRSLLKQMHHLHSHKINADKATRVAVFAKQPRYHVLRYIHLLAISFKLDQSQLVTNASHLEILKPSWLGRAIATSASPQLLLHSSHPSHSGF